MIFVLCFMFLMNIKSNFCFYVLFYILFILFYFLFCFVFIFLKHHHFNDFVSFSTANVDDFPAFFLAVASSARRANEPGAFSVFPLRTGIVPAGDVFN